MSNRLAVGLLGAACIAAAAGGGYLATRQNAVPVPAAAQSPALPATTAAPAAAAPVQETEATVGDSKKSSAPAAAPSSSRNNARRTDAATRPPQAPVQDSRAQTARRNEAPALTSSWPSSASQPPPAPAPPAALPEPPIQDRVAQEAPRPAEPARPTFEELVIARDSVIGLQLDNRVSSETARVEDRVDAHVARDVRVGDRVAIPAGSRVVGTVTQVDRGGKFKEQARLGVRFHTIVMADGTRLPISTETIVRFGDAPGNSSAAKIGGGAVGGAILGAILGGAKGAAIGATAGAGAGTAAVTAGDRSAVVLSPGTQLTPRILSPVTVTIEREREE